MNSSLRSGAGRPGLHNADIRFKADESGGEAQVTMKNGALEFPGVFAEPRLPFQHLSAQLAWRLKPAVRAGAPMAIELTVKKAQFGNDDVEGQLEAVWRSGAPVSDPGLDPGPDPGPDAGHPGVLNLSGSLARARAERVVRYLPLALPESVRAYVGASVLGGAVKSASFRVKGDLREFPFVGTRPAGSGKPSANEFHISARLQDVQLAYVPGQPAGDHMPAVASAWPLFTQLGGDLVFDRGAMRLQDLHAMQGGIALRGVQGGIKDLQRAVLQIDGKGRGPVAEWLRFVDGSPVGEWVGGSLHQASGSGNADLTLALTVPLDAPASTTVRGSVVLAGSTLKLRPDVPAFEDTRGRVDFSEGSVAIVGATARFLGGDASFEGGSAPNGGLRFSGRGSVSVDAVRRAPEAAALAPLVARLHGQAPYVVQLGFLRGQPEITLTSSLVGLAIDLPAPLAKPAEAAWPLRLQTTLLPDTVVGTLAGTPRDTLRFDLGKVIQARFLRDLSGATPRIERGGIGVFDEVPTPASGVAANLKLGAVDVDEWRRVVESLAVPASLAGAEMAGADLLPQTVRLRADRLSIAQRRLSNATVELTRQDDAQGTTWRTQIQADQAEGRIDLRLPRDGPGTVTARLARLSVPPADAAGVEELLQAAPASVPALDIVIDELEWRGLKLGQVEIEATNRGSSARPGMREWRLARFDLSTPDAQLRSSGVWAPGSAGPGAAGRRMVLDFRLAVADSGAFTERLGAGRAMRGGKGEMHGQLSWAGSPLAPDLASLGGQFSLTLADGQLLNVDPGAARLLGVLSLQMLPRRLLLDFRDVTQEGFGFDSLAGDFKVTRGVVTTSNLRVSGTQAEVTMDGRIDVPQETQDMHVVVVPEISTGAAALAVAAVNPAIGLGSLLAGALLRRPLAAAATREFRVSGAWAAPKIERIDGRKDGRADGRTDGRADGRTDGRAGGTGVNPGSGGARGPSAE